MMGQKFVSWCLKRLGTFVRRGCLFLMLTQQP